MTYKLTIVQQQMFSFNPQYKKGLSLIELLVAMGIMATLAVMSIYGIQVVQQSSRNSQRSSTLSEISSEINNFRSENSNYPSTGDVSFGSELLFSNYIPLDTIVLDRHLEAANETTSSSTKYYYEQTTDGFKLCAILEGGGIENTGTAKCLDTDI